MIVGVVLGVVIFLVIILAVLVFLYKRNAGKAADTAYVFIIHSALCALCDISYKRKALL